MIHTCDVCGRQKDEFRLWDVHGALLDLCNRCADGIDAAVKQHEGQVIALARTFLRQVVELAEVSEETEATPSDERGNPA